MLSILGFEERNSPAKYRTWDGIKSTKARSRPVANIPPRQPFLRYDTQLLLWSQQAMIASTTHGITNPGSIP